MSWWPQRWWCAPRDQLSMGHRREVGTITTAFTASGAVNWSMAIKPPGSHTWVAFACFFNLSPHMSCQWNLHSAWLSPGVWIHSRPKGPSYDTNQRSHTTIKRIAIYINSARRPFVGGAGRVFGILRNTVSIIPSRGAHSHTSLRYDLVTGRTSYHIILSIMRACITVECSK